jgi:L-fuconolactonase
MNRREMLGLLPATMMPLAAAPNVPVIDAHIHLFDTRRKGGIPWPPADDPVLYKTTLPARIRATAQPHGVSGAIHLEASPVFADNQWVLDTAQKDPFIVGVVGNLEPNHKDFGKQLERFRRNPLFRGIRYGNIWDRDLSDMLGNREFVDGLKLLAQADLSMDAANPDQRLLEAMLRCSDLAPQLRLVMDHLPKMPGLDDAEKKRRYLQVIELMGTRAMIHVKISAVLKKPDGKTRADLSFYKETLDTIYDTFGPDRIIYASDFPNSETNGNYAQVIGVVREWMATKPANVQERYFWRNSARVYKWKRRDASQPDPDKA